MAYAPLNSVHMMVPFLSSRVAKVTLFLANISLGFGLGSLAFSTSSFLLSGLSRHNVHPSSPVNITNINNFTNAPFWDPDGGTPLPEAVRFFIDLPSIHAPEFFQSVFNAFMFLNNPQSGATKLNILIECIMEGNRTRSLRDSFLLGPNYTMQEILKLLTEAVENFEAQSGTGEEGPSVIATRARVVNVSSAPQPESIPFTADPANVQWKKDVKADRKASKRPTLTLTAVQQLDSKIENLNTNLTTGFSQVVKAIKEQPSANNITSPLGVNWTPIIQGVLTGVAQSFGANVSFPSAAQTPGEVQLKSSSSLPPVNLEPILNRLNEMESKITNIESTLDKTIKELTKVTNDQIMATNNNVNNLTSQIELLAENITKVNDSLSKTNSQVAILFEAITSKDSKGNNNNGSSSNGTNSSGGGVSPQTAPTGPKEIRPGVPIISRHNTTSYEEAVNFLQQHEFELGPQAPEFKNTSNFDPFIHNEIDDDSDSEEDNIIQQERNNILEKGPPTELVEYMGSAKPLEQKVDFKNKIVTADLEAIITPEGLNEVYMAAWYNETNSNIFYLDPETLDKDQFLTHFWLDLIKNNEGRICYFHNYGGYDSIISLPQLLNCQPGLSFKPIMKDGELMCLEVLQETTKLITIKDSIRILPSSLSKLAKDWKVETLKDHFPHYFYLTDIKSTLLYEGIIPEYKCFEPKRTSPEDYEGMQKMFKDSTWSFLEVSKTYIMSDCKALYQVLIKFFESVLAKFPIDPTLSLSAPSTAFKIWRTVQLPWVGKNIADFSNTSWDTYLRQSYNGGIVDVYKFHLTTKGYYYDVNSLYPTAMCEPMPVGTPTKVDSNLWGQNFFGFIDTTVQAPANEYLGLLSIKFQGRLICPGGTFRGLFFSEELKFALAHGYKIIKIHNLIQFQKGGVFQNLILKLNDMKIQAQVQGQPTIRNLAKLLMNSMYGRFGMHTNLEQTAILNSLDYLKYTEVFAIISELIFGDYNLIHYKLKTDIGGVLKSNKLIKEYNTNIKQRTNVAIASAVTAYSRMIINKYKLKALDLGATLYYSDTDSMVIDRELPSTLVDSAKLGLLKLEHTVKEGIFALPKVYYLRTEDNKEIFKAKGYPKTLTRQNYIDLINEQHVTNLTINKWYRSLKDSTVQIRREQPYEIRYLFTKRRRTGYNSTLPLTLDYPQKEGVSL